jgi:hypothetical protein
MRRDLLVARSISTAFAVSDSPQKIWGYVFRRSVVEYAKIQNRRKAVFLLHGINRTDV